MIYYFTQAKDARYVQLMRDDGEMFIEETCYDFLSKWCILHGSTLEGRKKAVCHNLSIYQKVPILISSRTKDIVFPTRAMRHEECYWINYRAIYEVKKQGKQTKLIFLNGRSLVVTIAYRSMKRSMSLCKTYLEHLTSLR